LAGMAFNYAGLGYVCVSHSMVYMISPMEWLTQYFSRMWKNSTSFQTRNDLRILLNTWVKISKGYLFAKLQTKRLKLSNNYLKMRSEEHTSELQSRFDLVCRLL